MIAALASQLIQTSFLLLERTQMRDQESNRRVSYGERFSSECLSFLVGGLFFIAQDACDVVLVAHVPAFLRQDIHI